MLGLEWPLESQWESAQQSWLAEWLAWVMESGCRWATVLESASALESLSLSGWVLLLRPLANALA